MSGSFCVVYFTENEEVGVLPNSWLKSDTECVWPPYRDTMKIFSYISKEVTPAKEWKSFAIRILHYYGNCLLYTSDAADE